MTHSMHVYALILSFKGNSDYEAIRHALWEAYRLGHEFGLDRAVRNLQDLEVVRVDGKQP